MHVQIAAIALLDSLNILTLAIAAYLLGTPRPVRRTVSYIAGTAFGYFCAGAMLLLGWQALLDEFVPNLGTTAIGLVEAGAGMLLILGGLHGVRHRARKIVFRPPRRISPVSTFVLGAVIGLLYAPTDPRHNMAIGMIVAETGSYFSQLAWLLWYNAFYVTTLLAMLAVHVLWPERSDQVFGQFMEALTRFIQQTLPWLVLVAGLVLILDGVRRIVLLA